MVVGNPVRPPIRALSDLPYDAADADGPIRLLVTGGSQGARLLSELVPEAIAALPEALRQRLKVQQQTRPESMDGARRIYRRRHGRGRDRALLPRHGRPAGATPIW